MPHIIRDTSGTLVPDVFYTFNFLDDDYDTSIDGEKKWVVPRSPSQDELLLNFPGEHWLLAERINDPHWKEKKECPLDKEHVTWGQYTNPTVAVRKGTRIPAIIMAQYTQDESYHMISLVSEEMAKNLKQSGLTGFELIDVPIEENHSDFKDLSLYYFKLVSKKCLRPLKIVGVPNACPHCGYEPIICPVCAHTHSSCPKCKQPIWTLKKNHQGDGDRRLILARYGERVPRIMEGSKWDGSDFVYGGFLTKRALQWLLAVHAAPFSYSPALLCTDGMSEEQLAWLKQAQEPLSGMEKE